MESFLANRKILNLEQLRAAWEAWKMQQARSGMSLLPRQQSIPEPKEIDLESLSDEAISELKEKTIREYARQQRR
jgi:hypothetical protein